MQRSPLAGELERAWDDRVRANREQVERCSRVDATSDFYAPVSARFVEDPRRGDDPVRDALLDLARPSDTWLDIGAGAGRYALPLALRVQRVLAVDPSPAMLAALREGMERHDIRNVEPVEMRWPPDGPAGEVPSADVALIAHVGYDVAPIGPFLDAMESSASRSCVALLMNASPAGYASPFWPLVHGEPRAELPAFDELVALLTARGTPPRTTRLPRPPRTLPDEETLLEMLRHQLWISADDPAHPLLVAEVRRVAQHGSGGVMLPDTGSFIGLAQWPSGSEDSPEYHAAAKGAG